MNQYIKDSIRKRHDYNLKILDHLYDIVMKNPTLRFGQILVNEILPSNLECWDNGSFNANDLKSLIYNEEPGKTLSRLGGKK